MNVKSLFRPSFLLYFHLVIELLKKNSAFSVEMQEA